MVKFFRRIKLFFVKLFKHIKLLWIKKLGKPYEFHFVSDTEGEPIGPELKTVHLTLHDMAKFACRYKLTEEVVLKDVKANAIRIVGFKRINKYNGLTTFQPCTI